MDIYIGDRKVARIMLGDAEVVDVRYGDGGGGSQEWPNAYKVTISVVEWYDQSIDVSIIKGVYSYKKNDSSGNPVFSNNKGTYVIYHQASPYDVSDVSGWHISHSDDSTSGYICLIPSATPTLTDGQRGAGYVGAGVLSYTVSKN